MMKHDTIEILRQLKQTGITQEKLAAKIGVKQASVSRWANGSEPGLDDYFKLIRVATEYGIVSEDFGQKTVISDQDEIAEIDLVAGLGAGGFVSSEVTTKNGITFAKEVIRDKWVLPSWMLSRLNVKAAQLACFPAQGDSMEPTIRDGDVVFIDTRHRVPSPPGVYALADEFGGVVVKSLEVVSSPNDEFIKVRISSDNQKYRDKEVLLDEIAIIGRFVGKFTS